MFFLTLLFVVDSVFHYTRVLLGGTNIGRVFILALLLCFSFSDFIKSGCIRVNKYHCSLFILTSLLLLGYIKTMLFNGDVSYANIYIMNGFVYLLFLPIMENLIIDKESLIKFLKMSFGVGSILSIISVLLIISSFIMPSFYGQLINVLVEYHALNGISAYSGTIRIMLNGVLFQVLAIFVGVYLYFISKHKMMIIILVGINLLGIIFTYTRGLIFGVALGGLLWLFLSKRAGSKQRKNRRSLIILVLLFFVVLVLYSIVGSHGAVFSFLMDRFFQRTVDTLQSDMFRITLMKMAFEKILEAPIFGSGLGSHISLRDGAIEMTYLDIVIRIGIVGLICFLYPYLNMCVQLKNCDKDYLIRITLLSALTAIFIASDTNPYLITSGGFFIYCLCMHVFSFNIDGA